MTSMPMAPLSSPRVEVEEEGETSERRTPWSWIPTLYFDQGIPYVIAMTVSVVMYKNLGISNSEIALYTSGLYLPWVIKPLWSPVVDLFRTKRFWIVTLQGVMAAAFALIAAALHLPQWFAISLAVLWLVAFCSATHDIAVDGFYMLGLREDEQAAFVGVRSTFYRIATVASQGGLVFLAGKLAAAIGINVAWSVIFAIIAGLFAVSFIYHRVLLPRPLEDAPKKKEKVVFAELLRPFVSFFQQKDIVVSILFLLTFRLGEAQALKLVTPFLLDKREKGGLGLDTSDVGIAYGTVGLIALTVGGLLGGYVLSRFGLKRMIWIMLLSTHVPCFAFVFLSKVMPTSLVTISVAIGIEQFGYGFGFAAYLLFMILIASRGSGGTQVNKNKTAHYAICTGFMALGMMLPGMVSGFIQTRVGYPAFFLWVLVCAIPSLVVTAFVKIDPPSFGKKQS